MSGETVGYIGTGNLTQSGGTNSTWSLTLTLFPGSSGTYNLNGGLLVVQVALSQGNGTATFNFGGGTLDTIYGFSSSLNMNLTGNGGNATVDTTGGTIGLTGNLTGGGGLTVVGPSTLTLSGTNSSFSGPLTINGGTLQVPSGALTTPSLFVASSGTATVAHSGGSVSVTTLYVGTNSNNNGTYLLSGSAALSAGTECVGFSGNGVFTQTGGTNTISNELVLGNNAGASGTYNLFGGLLVVPNIIQGSGSASLNITGGSLTGGASGVSIALPIVLTSSGSSGTFNTSSSSLILAGPISGSGGLTKTGSATLVLSGNNTYSGGTTVSQGSLQLANANATQNTTVTVGVNNGLQFSGGIGSFNVGSIGGSGNLVLANTGGTAITLVTGGNNANTTYSGLISGAGTLVHNGSGTLVLTGTNTFTGGLILGPDAIGVSGSGSAGNGGITFSAGSATLFPIAPNVALANTFVLNTNVTGNIDTNGYTFTITGPITGSGNLSKTDSGTLILTNSNSYSGNTTISQGVLQLGNSAAVQSSTVNINVDSGLQFSAGIGTCSVGGLSGSNALRSATRVKCQWHSWWAAITPTRRSAARSAAPAN